jgi:hypothetical protein
VQRYFGAEFELRCHDPITCLFIGGKSQDCRPSLRGRTNNIQMPTCSAVLGNTMGICKMCRN